MIIPMISFVMGVVVLAFLGLVSLGYLNLNDKLSFLTTKIQRDRLFALGLGLIALALMAGLIGYLGYINGHLLRLFRLMLWAGGLGLILSRSPFFVRLYQTTFLRYLTIGNSLKIISFVFMSFLLIRSLIRVDGNGDTWMYQLPFAARIWHLVGPEHYLMDYERELMYNNFPKLANFLQGLFWSMAGINNPQAANLVSFLSLVLYLVFLKIYLKIPLYLSAIAILAVPLIHIAATACYVDLIGNVGVAIVILMTYLLYCRENFLNWRNIGVFTLGGFLAANTKFLLVPMVAIFFILALAKIIVTALDQKNINPLKIFQFLLISLISGIIIFATEFINVIQYQNPFYPLKISLGSWILNHAITPSADYLSPKLQAMSSLQRWIYSLLEIGAFDPQRPLPWTIAMDFVPLNSDSFGMGGYFAIYVIFNVVLFLFLCRRRTKETNFALGLFFLISTLTFLQPFSYQLRYYMYWIMVLIALNLFLIIQEQDAPKSIKWINPNTFGLVATSVLILFVTMTRWDYTYPRTNFLASYMSSVLDPQIMQQLEDQQKYCLVDLSPHTFLYNSQFHPPRSYSIRAEFKISPEYIQEQCASRVILPPAKIQS